MAERGVDVPYETLHKWVHKFGSLYANRIKARSERPSHVWYLDEIYTKMNGKMVYIWRAAYDEGTVLDIVVQSRKNTKAAKRLLSKLLRNQGVMPKLIVTDKRESYGAPLKKRKLKHLRDVGGRKNNRAENSHLPIRRRERKAQRFKSIKSALRQLSVYGPLYNLFNHRRHLISRNTLRKFRAVAHSEWKVVTSPSMG